MTLPSLHGTAIYHSASAFHSPSIKTNNTPLPQFDTPNICHHPIIPPIDLPITQQDSALALPNTHQSPPLLLPTDLYSHRSSIYSSLHNSHRTPPDSERSMQSYQGYSSELSDIFSDSPTSQPLSPFSVPQSSLDPSPYVSNAPFLPSIYPSSLPSHLYTPPSYDQQCHANYFFFDNPNFRTWFCFN